MKAVIFALVVMLAAVQGQYWNPYGQPAIGGYAPPPMVYPHPMQPMQPMMPASSNDNSNSNANTNVNAASGRWF